LFLCGVWCQSRSCRQTRHTQENLAYLACTTPQKESAIAVVAIGPSFAYPIGTAIKTGTKARSKAHIEAGMATGFQAGIATSIKACPCSPGFTARFAACIAAC
jgi:hypothetical protein